MAARGPKLLLNGVSFLLHSVRVNNGAVRALLRLQSACYPPLASHQLVTGHRWYLSLVANGVKQWEEARQQKSHEEFDLEGLCNTMIDNLETHRFSRRSNLNKLYDHVMTPEDLHLAEKVLTSFRQSFSWPRPGVPLVVVRACIRVGKPKRALHYIRNKVQYGIFPSQRVYKILMSSLLSNRCAQDAINAYEQLLADEIEPDGFTFFLAARAYAMLGTPEGLEKSLELCGKCGQLEPKLGTKAHQVVVKTLLKQGNPPKALEVLDQLQQESTLPKQTLLNLRVQSLNEAQEHAKAITLLEEELCNHGNSGLGVPSGAFPRLQQAVEEGGDTAVQKTMKALITRLEACGKLQAAITDSNPAS